MATVWWLRCLLDFDGVTSAFKVILGSATAVRTSRRSARGLNFFLAPLRGLLSKDSSVAKAYRLIKVSTVVRGTSVFLQISVSV